MAMRGQGHSLAVWQSGILAIGDQKNISLNNLIPLDMLQAICYAGFLSKYFFTLSAKEPKNAVQNSGSNALPY